MYQKFITKGGKKIGPYFYESIRLKDGKVKTIYLGNKETVALQRLETFRKQHGLADDPTPDPVQPITPPEEPPLEPSTPLHYFRQKITFYEQQKQQLGAQYKALRDQFKQQVISPELYLQKYRALFGEDGHQLAFIRLDSDISVAEQEILKLTNQALARLETFTSESPSAKPSSFSFVLSIAVLALFFGGLFFFHPSLTGFASLSSGTETFTVEPINLLTNQSMTYTLGVNSSTPLASLYVSGSYESSGAVQVYLVSQDYLVYASKEGKKVSKNLLSALGDAFSSLFSSVTGGAVLDLERSFAVMDGSWQEIPVTPVVDGNKVTLSLNVSTLTSLSFTDLQGETMTLLDQAQVLTPPEHLTFTQFYALNTTTVNFTEAHFTALAQGDALYTCRFWDMDLGLCLGSWEFVENLTKNQEYSSSLHQDTVAFAEAQLTSEITPPVNETNTTNGTNTTAIFTNEAVFIHECVDTCDLSDFNGSSYTLVVITNGTLVNISSVEYTFATETNKTKKEKEKEVVNETNTTEPPTNETQKGNETFGEYQISAHLQELLNAKERKITYFGLNETPKENKLKQRAFQLGKNCEGDACPAEASFERYFVKADDSQDFLTNALEADCEGNSEVCAKGKIYRADFKQTPLEPETIAYSKDALKIAYQPLQMRYVQGDQETLLSSANPIYGYGEDNKYKYPNIFGAGTELQLSYEASRLKEEIIFNDNSFLTANNLQGTEGYIYLDYLVTLTGGLQFATADGVLSPSATPVFFPSAQYATSSGNFALLQQPYISSSLQKEVLDYALRTTSEGLVLSIRVPLSLMTSGTYPLVIDPTTSATPVTDCSTGCLYIRDVNGTNLTRFDKLGNIDIKENLRSIGLTGTLPYGKFMIQNAASGGNNTLDCIHSGVGSCGDSVCGVDEDLGSCPEDCAACYKNYGVFWIETSSASTNGAVHLSGSVTDATGIYCSKGTACADDSECFGLTCSVANTCEAPSNIFKIQDLQGRCVSFVDSRGNLWAKGTINQQADI